MPSLDHELLVDLFRQAGKLAPALLDTVAGIQLPHAHAEPQSSELLQITPTEYHADAVVLLRNKSNTVTDGVIIEVQLQRDPDKRRSWPVYVTTLRARHDCPVVLLVLTPSSSVARWARIPIETGHPGFVLRPVVVSFEDIPRIVDLKDTRKLPQLAVLAAIAHPTLQIAEPAIEAILQLPQARARLYLNAFYAAVPVDDRKTLEKDMGSSSAAKKTVHKRKAERESEQETLSAFVAFAYAIQRRQGLKRGLQTVVSARLRVVRAADQAAIDEIGTEEAATKLLSQISKVRTAAQVREALAASLAASRRRVGS